MKKNLFVVASPLQIINANEAINYFSLINNVFVVIYNSNDIHNIQIDNILKNIKTDEVIKIKPSRNGKFFEYVKIIRYLKKYIYNYLFIGDMGSINRVIIPNLKKWTASTALINCSGEPIMIKFFFIFSTFLL